MPDCCDRARLFATSLKVALRRCGRLSQFSNQMLSKAGTGYRPRRLSRTTFLREDIDAHRFPDDIADPDAVRLQRLHDLCLVRPSEIQGPRAADGGAGE